MDVELLVEVRNTTGKGAARSLRRNEKVPAILYGPKAEPLPLSIPVQRLEKLLRDLRGESKLLRLTVDGGGQQQTRHAIIREVQAHPVRRRLLHVDFYEVPLEQAIDVEVHVVMVGEPVGVKKGGTLNLIRRSLLVRCLPADIPEKVEVDISGLDLGSTIHVRDLVGKVPFELADDPNLAVVNVTAPEGAAKESEGGEEASA